LQFVAAHSANRTCEEMAARGRKKMVLRSAMILGTVCFQLLMSLRQSCFVGGSLSSGTSRTGTIPRNFFSLPGGASSEEVQRAWAAYKGAYPKAVERGDYLGSPVNEGAVTSRFQAMVGTFGSEDALLFAELEPILLAQSPESIRTTYDYLKSIEEPESDISAISVLRLNPRLLTVSANEFSRTGSSLESLSQSAAAINVLRPLGDAGLSIAIFGGFILLLVVARVVLFGALGFPSIVDIVTSPFRAIFGAVVGDVSIPRLDTWFFETTGLNLAVLVLIFPILQAGQAIKARFFDPK